MSEIQPFTIEEVRQAAQRLRDVVVHTPLVPFHSFRDERDVLLKIEVHQPITSFKIRGVYNAVAVLDERTRSAGLSTVSAGNTAQALAWTARRFGVAARSLMPGTAPASKVEAVRAYGAEPILAPVEEVFRFLQQRLWEEQPYAFIHPWINRDVMIGHASMALEILEDCPDVETVYIPVGGGGLIGGVGGALKLLKREIRIIAVEPEGCPSLSESLRVGRPATVQCQTMCDGVAVPYITDEMFPYLKGIVDACRLVSENDVGAMVQQLALGNKIVAEPSAALAAAAAKTDSPHERGLSVCLVTGGNLDAEKLVKLLIVAR